MLGPNGYHRHFGGCAYRAVSAAQPRPEVQVRCDGRTGELVPLLSNAGSGPCSLTLQSNAYAAYSSSHTLAPRSETTLRLPVAGNGHWYDLSARVSGHPEYLRRLAGRVETGRHTVSDPALGA